MTRSVADAWRAILLRRPTWRAEAEFRAEYEAGGRPDARIAMLGAGIPGVVTIDLAEVDARPADPRSTDELLALEGRDGQALSLADALAPIAAYSLIARRYRRVGPCRREDGRLMGTEIERKFLVRDASVVNDADGIPYRQGYLSTVPERTVRIRIAGDHAYITIKGTNTGASRAEFEYEIPVDDARELLPMCVPPLIEKTRYRIEHGGLTWEVDVFEGENAGLVVAEVELPSADTPVDIRLGPAMRSPAILAITTRTSSPGRSPGGPRTRRSVLSGESSGATAGAGPVGGTLRSARYGRTSIGSIRAISVAGTFIRLTTAGSMANEADSAGLNSP